MFIFFIVYLIILLAVALYVSRKQSIKGYLLNNRKTSTFLLVLSNVATYIGAGATVFVVSEMARGNLLSSLGLALGIPLSFVLFGLIAGKIRKSGTDFNTTTISDFFNIKFGRSNRILMSILQLVSIALTIGIQVVAVSWLIAHVLGISYLLAVILLFSISSIYSAIGGLKADIITDAIQFFIIALLFVILVFFIQMSPNFGTDIIGAFNNMSDLITDKMILPFILLLVVMSVNLITQPTNWQLALSARDEHSIKKSCWWAAGITFIIQMMVLFFGLYAFGTMANLSNHDLAFFQLIQNTMPKWLAGLGFAGLLAISMSSLDSAFIAASAIITGEFRNIKRTGTVRLFTLLFGLFVFTLVMVFPSIATLGYFSVTWGLIPLPAVLIGMYGKKTSGKTIFLSVLIPMIMTLIVYPIIGFLSVCFIPLLSVLIIFIGNRYTKQK